MDRKKVQGLGRGFRACALVMLGVATSGCAPWKLDKSAQPAIADVERVRTGLEHVRRLHRAVYDVSTFAVDRCERKYAREPFALYSVGPLVDLYNKEQLAAYYQAAGFDETWRVMWADPSTGLKEGERVLEINGRAIENNKSGLGEFPAAKYMGYSSLARDEAANGKPFVVTMNDGRKLTIPTKPACRSNLYNNPVLNDEAFTALPRAPQFAMHLSPNAVNAAASEDEYRYLAGIVVYYQASEAAKWRDRSRTAVLAVGSAAALAMPLLYGVIALPTLIIDGKIRGADMTASSAAFASKVVADMGGDPYAGINFVTRMVSQNTKADRVVLDEEQLAALRDYLEKQYGKAAGHGNADRPSDGS